MGGEEKKNDDLEEGKTLIKEDSETKPSISTPNAVKNSKKTGIIALAANMISSVLLIIVNKRIFVSGFHYVLFLSFIHFIVTCIVLHAMLSLGFFTFRWLPLKEVAKVSGVCTVAIVAMNLSLSANTVGVYQLAKLLVIPVVVIVQYCFYGKVFSRNALLSLLLLVVGVGVATITPESGSSDVDKERDPLRFIYVLVAVVAQSFCQILIGSKQTELDASPSLLVMFQMHLNTVMILPFIPFIDNVSFSDPDSLWNFVWTGEITGVVILSCLLAGVLNISGFFVVGCFSPITYSVAGHVKTIAIIVCGVLVFAESVSPTSAFGIVLAVGGVIWWSSL
eukprot:TRINITY_DN1987_c0_g1_i1.p1 TRINITY_DN1987_c0_g1~~TRINITY_DN1987_c0_g1_i1.p1  ORF type:complete len:336 (+),score=83.43 TRINITY_DN1987_c0_g1_i1:78-1085(+)